jgi:hypothetical protein
MKVAYAAVALLLVAAACKTESSQSTVADARQSAAVDAGSVSAAPRAIVWKAGEEDRERLHKRLLEEKTGNSLGLREVESMLASQGYEVTFIEYVDTLPPGLSCHCDRADVTVNLSKVLSEADHSVSAYELKLSYGAGHQGFDPNAGASISDLTLTYKGVITPAIEPMPQPQ